MADRYYLLLADSVGLPRPANGVEYADTVAAYLSAGGHLWLLSRVGAIVTEFVDQMYQLSEVMPERFFGTAVVQVGLADCAPRPITPHLRNLISHLPRMFRQPLAKLLHLIRPVIQKRRYYQRVRLPEFKAAYSKLMFLARQMAGKVIVLSIPPVRDDVERQSPGFQREIARYNEAIMAISSIYGCRMVDLSTLLQVEHLTKDAHITKAGHKIILDALKEKVG